MAVNVQKFIESCDELVDCKFLVAENKIQKLLGSLAQCEEIYSLVGECMEQFNRDREMTKAFVQGANGSFACNMPTEEFKIIALVFCTLADINAGKIDFNDFIKRFFADEPTLSPYRRFVSLMVLPFRNLIAEAFGIAKRDIGAVIPSAAEIAQLNEDNGVLPEQSEGRDNFNEIILTCQRIANQILDELALLKPNAERDEIELICYGILMATAEEDYDYLHPLVIGLKHTAKGVRAIKFFVREMVELIEDYAAR